MWERFGFYLMLGIMTLFLMDTKKGGFGYSEETASEIYGTFLALCYITPVVGGLIAERVLGFRLTVLIGAISLMSGYFLLAVVQPWAFYAGLLFIVLGNGMFKPNVSSMLGKSYPDGSKLLDPGYKIFYMGINLAGLICNFVAAYLRHNYGWNFAFAGAGIGMALSVLLILIVYKRLKPIDDATFVQMKQPRDPNEVGFKYMVKWTLPQVAILSVLGYYFFDLKWAFLIGCIPIIIFYVMLWATAKKEEKGPLGALLVMFAMGIPFFTIYGLNGAALTFWAKDNTEREFSGEAIEWTMDTFKFGEEVTAESDYFKNVKSRITAEPTNGKSIRIISTEIFQSVNPFFIVTLIPIIAFIMSRLERKKMMPNVPIQVGIGLLLAACAMVVMYYAQKESYASDGSLWKVSAWWLIFAYFFATAAECFVSPGGLTMVRQMAPKRFTAVMMGGFFIVSIAVGLKLAGVASGLWNKISHESLFLCLAGFAIFFAMLVFSLNKWIDQYIPKDDKKKE